MQTIKNYIQYILILPLVLVLAISCGEDDAASATRIDVLGPANPERGSTFRIIGDGLLTVSSVVFSQNVEVTSENFTTYEQKLIELTVPQATVDGPVLVNFTSGNVYTSIFEVEIAEPIVFSLGSSSVRPGATLSLTNGKNLDLVDAITFSAGIAVAAADFESQSAETIQVNVPMNAQTGPIVASRGSDEDLVEVESDEDLIVALPNVTNVAPNPIKAGATLTLTGTDLDLITGLTFSGDNGANAVEAADFTSQSATTIEVVVPDGSDDGVITLNSLSPLSPETESLTMSEPSIATIPADLVKNGGDLTITGTDLDLVTSVAFEGGASVDAAAFTSQEETSIELTIPMEAQDGAITLSTAAGKTVVSTGTLSFTVPTITNFTASVNTVDNPSITIDGTDLDVVANVWFTARDGDETEYFSEASGSDIQIQAAVPAGSITGIITLQTTNGTLVDSETELTIVPEVPDVTVVPATIFVDAFTTIEGTNMDIPFDIVLPGATGDIFVTSISQKSATSLTFYVPPNVTLGEGTIELRTYKNEVLAVAANFDIAGVIPIVNESDVLFDFDGKNAWWGDMAIANDGSLTLDGSNYGEMSLTGAAGGWNPFFFRNTDDGIGGPLFQTIGTNVANYDVMFDMRVLDDVEGGYLQIRLQVDGDDSQFIKLYGPGGPAGESIPESPWQTIVIPVTDFVNNYGWGDESISDANVIRDFGINYGNDGAPTDFHVLIDNFRVVLRE